MNQPNSNFEWLPSAWRLFFRVLLVVSLAESMTHFFLVRAGISVPGFPQELLDSATLSSLLAPFLWWWLIRPLGSAAMRERMLAASIIDTSADAIITIDDCGRITTFNPAAERLFGYTKSEAVGQSVKMLMPAAERAQHDEHMARYLRTGEKRVIGVGREVFAQRKDGVAFPIYLSVGEARERGRPVFAGIVHDLTERKRAEAALRQSEERYRALVESLPVIVYYAQADPPYSPLYLNSNIEALGYSTEEWYSQPDLWVSVLHPDDREWVLRATEAAKTAGAETEYEYRVVAKDGSIRWLHDRGLFCTDASGVRTWQGVILDVTERKRSEEALRKGEERYRDLIENSREIVCTHDLDGKILSVNRAAFEVLGYEISEIVNQKTIRDVLAPEVRDQFRDYMNKIIEEGANAGLMLVQTKSGERRILEYYNSLRTEGVDKPIVRAIARDITKQRQAEKALRQSEERYRDLVENAHDIIYSHDLRGNYQSVNRAAELITGYTRDECLKMNLTQSVAPESLEKAREMIRRKLEGEKVTAYEIEIMAKDSRRIAVEVNTKLMYEHGVPVGVQGIARDITERKLAQAELTRLAAAVEQTADSIMITDFAGNIEYVNPAFERITGYSRADALGRNPRMLKSGKNDSSVYAGLWHTITQGGVWTGQLVNRKKDGTLFNERATISAVRDESGRIAHYVAVKQDITHEIQLEEQLRQSQKMEAIGQLAGGVAHDFNNLLTAINGYSGLALQRIDGHHPLKGHLEEIKKAGERAANLTRQLLAFGRKQILQPLPINLNDVVSDINKMLRRLIGENITLIAKLDARLKRIQADPGQIEQVLVNLVVNARDAMPHGGRLTIETANVDLDREYAARRVGAQPGSYVMLAVSDTGVGMTEEVKSRIFDPFFTTKEKEKGTGLGLSTVYGIVKQSGGNIWVYSEPDRGTTFKLYLPQLIEPARTTEQVDRDDRIAPGNETILLVEDEDVVRGLTRKILEQAGYKVFDTSRGEDAVQFCAAEGSIDLLLTDVVMPRMSGKDVADQATELVPGLKVIFMSGYTDEAIVHHGVLDSNVQFIQKPFTPAALSRKLREVLDKNGNKTK